MTWEGIAVIIRMFFDSTATETNRSRFGKVALIIVSFGKWERSNSAEEFRSLQKFPRKPSEAKVTSWAAWVRAHENAKSAGGAFTDMTKVKAVMNERAGQVRTFKRRRKTRSFPRLFSKRFQEWAQVMSARGFFGNQTQGNVWTEVVRLHVTRNRDLHHDLRYPTTTWEEMARPVMRKGKPACRGSGTQRCGASKR